jgi:hypothetical protein
MDPISRTVCLGSAAGAGLENYWITTFTSATDVDLFGINADSSNNVYVSGNYTVASQNQIYIASLDASGATRWQKYIDEPSTPSVYSRSNVGIDSSGYIYVAGQTRVSSSDAFLLVKYDDAGSLQWQKYLNASGSDVTYGLSIDASDNVYVAGVTNASSAPRGITVQYDTSGAVQWQKQLSASSTYYDAASDSSGNSYYCGLGDGTLTRTLTVKYNSSGTQQWARRVYSASGVSADYIAVDSSFNVYVLVNDFSEDRIVLVKYDPNGILQWQRQIGNVRTTSIEVARGLYVTSSDEIYVCGYTSYQASNAQDILMFKYDTAGAVQWKRQLGNTAEGLAPRRLTVANDSLYICGTTNTADGLAIKLPSNGSLTGTYGNWEYKTSSLPEASSSYTDGSTTLTSSSSSLTAGTPTLSDVTASLTVSTTTL